MTPQEALKFLDEHCTASVIPFEVKVLCSNALEKQIPKKPIKETEETGFKDRFICVSVNRKEVNYRCPVCGEPLGTNYSDDYYNEWLNVCNNCFQRIDWESDNQ